ncbi:hypothetical protein BACPU_23350 [Bacillus pumilus]|nr:hypothetical protein BACPU_23350 [Bacillus pumilus]
MSKGAFIAWTFCLKLHKNIFYFHKKRGDFLIIELS